MTNPKLVEDADAIFKDLLFESFDTLSFTPRWFGKKKSTFAGLEIVTPDYGFIETLICFPFEDNEFVGDDGSGRSVCLKDMSVARASIESALSDNADLMLDVPLSDHEQDDIYGSIPVEPNDSISTWASFNGEIILGPGIAPTQDGDGVWCTVRFGMEVVVEYYE